MYNNENNNSNNSNNNDNDSNNSRKRQDPESNTGDYHGVVSLLDLATLATFNSTSLNNGDWEVTSIYKEHDCRFTTTLTMMWYWTRPKAVETPKKSHHCWQYPVFLRLKIQPFQRIHVTWGIFVPTSLVGNLVVLDDRCQLKSNVSACHKLLLASWSKKFPTWYLHESWWILNTGPTNVFCCLPSGNQTW